MRKDFLDKYRFEIAAAIAVVIVAVVVYNSKKRKKGIVNNISNNSKFLVCSHITAIDDNAGTKAENNLKNISLLLNNNIDMIEMDVQITKDGVPVLFHDTDLSPKTDMSGEIKNKNWSQVEQARYKSDKSQGITKLEDAIDLLKKSGKSTIFQLDKCDKNEIAKIDSLGLFKGVEKQMLAKSLSFEEADSIKKAGILYMPMLPNKYVGKMTSENIINEIAEQCKGRLFIEAQFNGSDTLLIDGSLSKKLEEVGCKLFVVAVPGGNNTNASSFNGDKKYFRGDSIKQWSKMINPMGAKAIMTNYPLALKKYVDDL